MSHADRLRGAGQSKSQTLLDAYSNQNLSMGLGLQAVPRTAVAVSGRALVLQLVARPKALFAWSGPRLMALYL
jgi:hypothetical protein